MKLPDILQNEEFNAMRQQMGADLVQWNSSGSEWEPFEIEIPLDRIVVDIKTKTLTYNGETVIVYIRDQYIRDEEEIEHLGPEELRKFHITDCTTLQEMRRKRKFDERYVATNRTDGKFTVNFLERFGRRLVREGRQCELHVCKNCLSLLNYQDYSHSTPGRKNEIRDTFDRKEFFDKYGSQITTKPKYTDETAPVNTYTDDWDEVSRRCKEEAEWKCEECQADLEQSRRRKFLHVHHIDGQKHNNKRENLKVLCIECHAEVDPQLKFQSDYTEYQNLKGDS